MTETHPDHLDAFGMVGPLPVWHGQRLAPDPDFATGPEVGSRLPDIVLTSADGRLVDVHADRDGGRAAVVFYRSAVW